MTKAQRKKVAESLLRRQGIRIRGDRSNYGTRSVQETLNLIKRLPKGRDGYPRSKIQRNAAMSFVGQLKDASGYQTRKIYPGGSRHEDLRESIELVWDNEGRRTSAGGKKRRSSGGKKRRSSGGKKRRSSGGRRRSGGRKR
jgi:hypothetical protein